MVITTSTAGVGNTTPTDSHGDPFGPDNEDLFILTPYELMDPNAFSLDYEKLLEDQEIPEVPRRIGRVQMGFPPTPLSVNRKSLHPG